MLATLTQAQENRAVKWSKSFVGCKKHPWRRCNRSDFVLNRCRRCGSCKSNGRPAYHRYRSSARRSKLEHYRNNPRGFIRKLVGL